MHVYRKKMPNGKLSPTYYYDFVADGIRRSRSTGCSRKRDAEAFARDKLDVLRQQSSALAIIEIFRDHLAGVAQIKLEDVFEEFKKTPKEKAIGAKQLDSKESYWNDFLAFLAAHHPQVKLLTSVTQKMAEEYLTFLRSEGRFVKRVEYKRAGRRKSIVTERGGAQALSKRTCNVYHKTLQQIFSTLYPDDKLVRNPFRQIPKLKLKDNDSRSREPFPIEELKLINEKAQDDPFLYPIITLAANTGLRKGDVCTLKWSDVRWDAGVIERTMNKTGKTVRIPILPPVETMLRERQRTRAPGAEYVMPEQAATYLSSPDAISQRFKKLLGDLGISTTSTVGKRTRQASTKDLHSFRHTFCYQAAIHGVPANVVQSTVGHLDPKLTEHYANHATDHIKRQFMGNMPLLIGSASPVTVDDDDGGDPNPVSKVADLLKHMTDDNVAEWPKLRDQALELLEQVRKEPSFAEAT